MNHYHHIGRGICVYDRLYDTLTFQAGLLYHHSLEFENFVVDFDEKEQVSGLRVFDASQTLGINQDFLDHVSKHSFKVSFESGVVEMRVSLVGNKGQRSTHQVRMPLGVQHVPFG